MIYFTKPNRRLRKVTDLRPITLINEQLKNGETLFARGIESELNGLKFFEPNQFGSRTGASTAEAIEKVTKELKNSRKRVCGADRPRFQRRVRLDELEHDNEKRNLCKPRRHIPEDAAEPVLRPDDSSGEKNDEE